MSSRFKRSLSPVCSYSSARWPASSSGPRRWGRAGGIWLWDAWPVRTLGRTSSLSQPSGWMLQSPHIDVVCSTRCLARLVAKPWRTGPSRRMSTQPGVKGKVSLERQRGARTKQHQASSFSWRTKGACMYNRCRTREREAQHAVVGGISL